MDSLDAQCLLIEVTGRKIRPPDLWWHDRAGALTCAYEDGTQTFTWPPADVGELARKWRERGSTRPPKQTLALRDAHERLAAMISEAALDPADMVIHDVRRGELRAVWEESKVVLVVEQIGETASSHA